MPYIDSVVTVKMSDSDKENLKAKLGEAIYQIPGKSEDWLFIRLQDNQSLFFKGELKDKAAIVEVKLLGNQPTDVKDRFTSLICNIYEKELGIPKDNVYVIFYEVTKGNWGWNGSLF
jgi:phenylpyruvate tautomerase PptA (4-oxalocrotonate tautomerase family)